MGNSDDPIGLDAANAAAEARKGYAARIESPRPDEPGDFVVTVSRPSPFSYSGPMLFKVDTMQPIYNPKGEVVLYHFYVKESDGREKLRLALTPSYEFMMIHKDKCQIVEHNSELDNEEAPERGSAYL